MKYCIYKLNFTSGLHAGNGKLSDTGMSIHADTVFSALCLEALKVGGNEMLDKLVGLVKADRLRISDGFPYIGDTLYLPKPMISLVGSAESNSAEKKAYKKLKYISVGEIETYLAGKLDVKEENAFFSKNFGEFTIRTMVNLDEEDDAKPYSVGVFQFEKDAGLYLILGFHSEEEGYFVGDLLDSLSYTGLGGKRSSGLGKFKINMGKVPQFIKNGLLDQDHGQKYMALSVCLPEESVIKEALEGARYGLIKRSGFVSSGTYANSFQKKKDLIAFLPGSCFTTRFQGVLADVSAKGAHPVYSYGKSLLMRIN